MVSIATERLLSPWRFFFKKKESPVSARQKPLHFSHPRGFYTVLLDLFCFTLLSEFGFVYTSCHSVIPDGVLRFLSAPCWISSAPSRLANRLQTCFG